jgi:uncharacterized RDD family membrane protein YckC
VTVVGGAAIIQWIYAAALESSARQATFGKRAAGIIVTDEHWRRISFGRATGRHFAKYLSGFLMLGYLVALLNARRQTLHDRLAGTLVVQA